MGMFLAIAVVILVVLIALAATGAQRARDSAETLQAAITSQPNFTPNRVLLSSDSESLLAVDESSGLIGIAKQVKRSFTEMSEALKELRARNLPSHEQQAESQRILQNNATTEVRVWSHTSLMSVEIVEDGTVVTTTSRSSQLGGALVGGLAFGGVGALAGALTGSKSATGHVSRIELLIKVDDMSAPVHRIPTHIGQLVRSSTQYKEAREKAEKWAAILEILMRRVESPPAPIANAPVQAALSSPSVADELRKLSELHRDGLLTADEFENQKRKLLG